MTRIKLDEFEEASLGECDFGARMDNLAIELQSHPGTKGFVIYYDGQNDPRARVMQPRYMRYLEYLINTRGLDASRIAGMNGGFREKQFVEMWIVPEGVPDPVPTNTVAAPVIAGRTYKYNDLYLEFPYDESEIMSDDAGEDAGENDSVQAPLAASPAEEQPLEFNPVESEEVEIYQHPEAEETQEAENDDYLFDWASEGYADAVKEEKDARACIIYYADSESSELRKLQDIIERGKSLLVEKYGLKASNIIAVYGGYSMAPEVETWVVPANASLPAPTPQEIPNDWGEEVIDVP